MKVLEKGRTQKGWSTEIVCTGAGFGGEGCGAKLLVEQPDLYTVLDGTGYAEGLNFAAAFTCSECGVETKLGEIPTQVLRKLPKRIDWLVSPEKEL
jgi:hypothetical protein